MNIIYKYQINSKNHEAITKLDLPLNSKLLNMQIQNGIIRAWFEIDVNELSTRTTRTFVCIFTGNEFNNNNLKFLKTLVFGYSSFVAHIYEKIEEKFLSDDEMRL